MLHKEPVTDIFAAIENYKTTKSVTEILKLVQSGIDLTVTNASKQTPMQVLRSLDFWELIDIIAALKKSDAKDNARYGDALITAVDKDKIDTVKALLEAGARVTWYFEATGSRCMHIAVKKKNIKMIALLLEYNAELTDENTDKQTPIQLAAALGCWDIVKVIADSKETNKEDKAKYTDVLFSAIKAHQASSEPNLIKVIKSLIKAGADLTALNADKKTAIQLAETLEKWDCIETIAKSQKAGKEDSRKYGDPLLTAVTKDKYDTAKILLEAGASTTWYSTTTGYKCLHWAVKNRNVKMIELLLKHSADVTGEDKNNKTPIELAADFEFWDCVEILAKHKNTSNRNEVGKSYALLQAVIKGQINTVKVLIQEKTLDNCTTVSIKNTCLHEAVMKDDNLEMVQMLLQHGANLAAVNDKDYTPIEFAASKKQWGYVKAIVNSKKIDENDTARYGSALYKAVVADEMTTVIVLLEAKAATTWMSIETNNGCLHSAVTNNNPKMIELLLKHGADIHKKNKAGQTPLELACALGKWESAEVFVQDKLFKFKDSAAAGIAFIDAVKAGKLDIAKYLMNAGASITEKTKPDGYTALHWAVIKNDTKAIRFLLDNNASQIAVSDNQETPVELAARLGYSNCVQMLVENNPARVKNKSKTQALHYENALLNIIKAGDCAITRLFLEHHAPCNAWNSEYGNIPLYWAVKANRPDIVSVLLEYGAKPNIPNKASKTTRDFAKELGHIGCIKALDKTHANELDYDISTLIDKRDELFDAMMENAVPPEALPSSLKDLTKYETAILKNVLEALREQREQLSMQPQLSSMASILSNTKGQKFNLGILVSAINTLLNYPDQSIIVDQIYGMQNQGCVEAGHILTFIGHKQQVDAYVQALRSWLDKLQQSINEKKTWKVKNLIGIWVDGIPDHITDIQNELNKIKPSSTANDIISIYSRIIIILSTMPVSERRHDETIKFYADRSREYKSISFANSSLPYSYQYPIQVNGYVPVLEPVYYANNIPVTSPNNEGMVYSQYPFETLPPSYERATTNNNIMLKSGIYPDLSRYGYAPLKIDNAFPQAVTNNTTPQLCSADDWHLQNDNPFTSEVKLDPVDQQKESFSLLLPVQPVNFRDINPTLVTAEMKPQEQFDIEVQDSSHLSTVDFNNSFPPIPQTPQTQLNGIGKSNMFSGTSLLSGATVAKVDNSANADRQKVRVYSS